MNYRLLLILISFYLFLGLSFGQKLNWGHFLEDQSNILINDSKQFSNGDILIAGTLLGTFQIGSNPSSLTNNSPVHDGFMARIDTNGNLVWSKALRGSWSTILKNVAIGSGDTIFVSGTFTDTVDLDPSSSNYLLYSGGRGNIFSAFIGKYDEHGNFLRGGRIYKQNGHFSLHAPKISLSASNSLYITFETYPLDSLDIDLKNNNTHFLNLSNHIGTVTCLINYTSSLGYQWHKVIYSNGGSFSVKPVDININVNNDIHITGIASNNVEVSAVHPGPELQITTNLSNFWLVLDSRGNYKWIRSLGKPYGVKNQIINDHLTGCGFIWFVVSRNSPAINLGSLTEPYLLNPLPNRETSFVAKFDSTGSVKWGFRIDPELMIGDMAIEKGNLKVCGAFRNTADFNHGIRDSIFQTSGNYTEPYIINYDSEGQFLSGFKLNTNEGSRSVKIFNSPASSSITYIAWSLGTIDLDPDPISTQNISSTAPGMSFYGIASYSFPCVPATSLGRDTFSSHFDYCSNEYLDLYFPRKASGYSNTIWQVDTGNGFNNLDSSTYQIVNDNLRLLNTTTWDTTLYRGIISNNCGIDTTDTVSLYIRPSYLDNVHYTLCKNDTINIKGVDYYYPIQFKDSLTSQFGCDSVIVYNVDQYFPNAYIFVNGTTLMASTFKDGYSYQWLECPSLTPIPGATDSIFIPADTGKYALVVTEGGCSDTSDCFSSTIGLNERKTGLSVYPNPNNGIFFLKRNSGIGEPLNIIIQDINGRVLESYILSEERALIKLKNKVNGLFIVEIRGQDQRLFLREKLIIHQ